MSVAHPGRAASFLLGAWMLLLGVVANADDDADAEALVRSQYFEGIPYGEAAAVGPAGAARLVEMLSQPVEAPHHAAVLEVLGMCGQPGAYEAIAAYAATQPTGAVSGATWRARLAIPLAMGHLARSDRRALRYLIRASDARAPADWTYRSMNGAAVAVAVHRRVIQGLGLSGAPRADAVLRRLPASPPVALSGMGTFSDVRSQVEEARALRARIAGEGAAAALSARAPGTELK